MKKNNISKIVACISIALVVGVVLFFALKNDNSEDNKVDTVQNNEAEVKEPTVETESAEVKEPAEEKEPAEAKETTEAKESAETKDSTEAKESTEAEDPVQKTESELDIKYSLIGKNLSKIDNDMEECDAYSDGVYEYEFIEGTDKLIAVMIVSENELLSSDDPIATVSDYIKKVYPSWNLNPDNWKIVENEPVYFVNYYSDEETAAVSFTFNDSGKLAGGNIFPTAIDKPAPDLSGNDISEEEAIIIAKKYVEEHIEKEKAKGVTYVAQDFSTYVPSAEINHKRGKDYWFVKFSKTSDDQEVFEPYSYVCELYMNGDLSYVDKSK